MSGSSEALGFDLETLDFAFDADFEVVFLPRVRFADLGIERALDLFVELRSTSSGSVRRILRMQYSQYRAKVRTCRFRRLAFPFTRGLHRLS